MPNGKIYQSDIDTVKIETDSKEGSQNVSIQWLLTRKDGAPTFALRRFIFKKGGSTQPHYHPWEHEVYILKGKGVFVVSGEEREVKEGDFLLIDPNAVHSTRNTGDEDFTFLCAIPNSYEMGGTRYPGKE